METHRYAQIHGPDFLRRPTKSCRIPLLLTSWSTQQHNLDSWQLKNWYLKTNFVQLWMVSFMFCSYPPPPKKRPVSRLKRFICNIVCLTIKKIWSRTENLTQFLHYLLLKWFSWLSLSRVHCEMQQKLIQQKQLQRDPWWPVLKFNLNYKNAFGTIGTGDS